MIYPCLNLPSRLHVEEGNFKPFSSAKNRQPRPSFWKVGLRVDPFLGVWPGKDLLRVALTSTE